MSFTPTLSRLRALLREPLVHFLVAGLVLFILYSLVGSRPALDSDPVVVTPGKIANLAMAFTRTWQRPPTRQELNGLIEDYIREEVFYREARAMGMDQDDTIIRRRLRQKMEFLTEESADARPPSEAELQAYLDQHVEAYRLEPQVAFRQVYISPDRRGESVEDDARRLLTQLVAEGAAADISERGDSLMLPQTVSLAPQFEIERTFGAQFTEALLRVEPGNWVGPIQSGYGLHLVFVSERVDGRVPSLAEVREAVLRDLLANRRKQALDDTYKRLRDQYEVVVQWPAPEAREKPAEAK